MLNSFKKTIGIHGEQVVEEYLVKNGYQILKKNFSIRGGEIDLIAQKNDVIAFVEVKTRTTPYFNTSEVVTPSKQKKIIYTAKHFISQHNFTDTSFRFDVALVEGSSEKITYIEHAFSEF